MEYKNCLLDSNVVIDFIAAVLPEKGMNIVGNIINATANISLINKMELLGVDLPDKHIKPFQIFVESTNVLEISDEIAEKTIYIRRHHKIKLPDAIIAATAIVHNHILVTRNEADFKNINKLKIFNPYKL